MSKEASDKFEETFLRPVEISVDFPSRQKGENRKGGLKVARKFTKKDEDVFDKINWTTKDSVITDEKGDVISHIRNVEVPEFWSQIAADILAYKYFRKAGVPTKEGREISLKQTVHRIAHTLADFGEKFDYFASSEDRQAFEDELKHLLIHQKAAFNSPVWFNVGLYHQYKIEGSSGGFYWDFKSQSVKQSTIAYRNPQCSACFILSVKDTLTDIFELIKTESHIFKYGSGTGANFSPLRSRYERLSGGGFSSGMMSFLKVFDRAAGATKSGGTTRRAAKMVIVNIDHPEIEDFIDWKVKEEEKVKHLIMAGYDPDFNGEAYSTISGQNSNNSVRLTDEFLEAYEQDKEWQTRLVTTGEPHKTYKARELMEKICQAAWVCADPGLQFDTTINQWHTCPNTNRINASNPCSEYMFLDDSACNLASLNLMRFLRPDNSFDVETFRHAVRTMTIAQEIIVDFSSYPTEEVARNSHDYRPLGLGYANLGALLMSRGIPYDSDKGRSLAAAISAVMSGHAYKTSAEIAAFKGPFEGFKRNRSPMLNVIRKHRSFAYKIDERLTPKELLDACRQDWDEALAFGEQFGFRNSQISVIAPTGTIGLLMDCDTTGIEPDFALVKFKKLAGGGSLKIINQSVEKALKLLGYSHEQEQAILRYIVGSNQLSGNTPINTRSLLEKGFSLEDIKNIEEALPGAFSLEMAFNALTITDATKERLNLAFNQNERESVLIRLGFSQDEINQSAEEIIGTGTVEGAPYLKEEHYPIFDCANICGTRGTRYLEPMSHVKMMAAVQPFISGAISKTINLPNHATVEDIKEVYLESWRRGLKAVAVYRDGSKHSQPLSSTQKKEPETEEPQPKIIYKTVSRRRLPDERKALTHKFQIANHKGYLTVGLYDDGTPGEIFITIAKEGSLISGLMDSLATSISLGLQYGLPLSVLVRKFAHVRFEPSGFTSNPQIPVARSIVDYIARYLAKKFLTAEEQKELGINDLQAISSAQEPLKLEINENVTPSNQEVPPKNINLFESQESEAPVCATCGSLMYMKTGSCYTCLNCGSTSGGCG